MYKFFSNFENHSKLIVERFQQTRKGGKSRSKVQRSEVRRGYCIRTVPFDFVSRHLRDATTKGFKIMNDAKEGNRQFKSLYLNTRISRIAHKIVALSSA